MGLPRIIVVVTFLLVVGNGQEVHHAPTLQACTADMNLWWSQIPQRGSMAADVRAGTKNLTVKELNNRKQYISDCANAYPQMVTQGTGGDCSRMPRSFSLSLEYQGEIDERMSDFLERHNLIAKFYEEDEAGQR